MNLLRVLCVFFFISCGSSERTVPLSQIGTEEGAKIKTDDAKTLVYKQINFQTLNYFTIMKSQTSAFDRDDEFGLIPNNPEDTVNRQVPTDVLKLDGANIQISGFVYPMKLKQGNTSGFVLMSILPSCCFGDVLNVNDIIYVDAMDDLKKLKKDQFVTVKGKLTIGMTQMIDGKEKFLYWLKAKEVVFGKPGL